MGKVAVMKWHNEENCNPCLSIVKEPLIQPQQGANTYCGFIHFILVAILKCPKLVSPLFTSMKDEIILKI